MATRAYLSGPGRAVARGLVDGLPMPGQNTGLLSLLPYGQPDQAKGLLSDLQR